MAAHGESAYKAAMGSGGSFAGMQRGLLARAGIVVAAMSAAASLGAAMPGGARAAEPSLTVNGAPTGGMPANVQSLLNAARTAAAAAGAGTGPTIYVDPSTALEATQGFGGLGAADQSFARAIAGGYELYKALGGSGTDRQAVIQRKDGMYYVGLDGEGGRWFASAEQALSFMFNSLVAKDEKISSRAKKLVLTCAQDILCAVLAVAQDRYATIATVARGSTVDVTITGSGFSNAGGTPVVAASDGIFTQSVTYIGSEKLGATLEILPSARLGENFVVVFNPGRGFQNTGAYKVMVVDGGGAAAASGTAATNGATAASLTRAAASTLSLNTPVQGKLLGAGAEQYYRIDVTRAGTLTVASSGGTDVKGTLEDSGGQALASGDDEGGWYNFRLSQQVQPGTYYLRVGHCCGGIGAFQIDASMAP